MHYAKIIVIGLFIFILNACGEKERDKKAKVLSEHYCNCLEKSGLDNPTAYQMLATGINKNLNEQMDSCTTGFKEELLQEIESLEKDEQTEFLKSVIKAVIDSDCGVAASEAIPFDLLNAWYEEQNN